MRRAPSFLRLSWGTVGWIVEEDQKIRRLEKSLRARSRWEPRCGIVPPVGSPRRDSVLEVEHMSIKAECAQVPQGPREMIGIIEVEALRVQQKRKTGSPDEHDITLPQQVRDHPGPGHWRCTISRDSFAAE